MCDLIAPTYVDVELTVKVRFHAEYVPKISDGE